MPPLIFCNHCLISLRCTCISVSHVYQFKFEIPIQTSISMWRSSLSQLFPSLVTVCHSVAFSLYICSSRLSGYGNRNLLGWASQCKLQWDYWVSAIYVVAQIPFPAVTIICSSCHFQYLRIVWKWKQLIIFYDGFISPSSSVFWSVRDLRW